MIWTLLVRRNARIEKLKMSFRAKIRRSFLLGIASAVALILFIKILGCHPADQSGQDNQRNQVGESHEGVGHISYVPNNIQVHPLDDRTDEKQRDECDPERKDDFDAKDVLQAFLPVITPSQQCGIAEKKGTHSDDVPSER